MSDIFQHNLTPQYYDCDPSNVVHNTIYVRWLEDTRTAFQRESTWPPERLYAEDLVPALMRTEVLYRAPIKLGDAIGIRVWILKVGKSSWSLLFHFVHSETGSVYATAEQSGCFVRKSTHKPAAMPPEFLAFCRDYQERTGPPPVK